MGLTGLIDTALDRSVVLGYTRPGLWLRRALPGWPADPPRMDGRTVLVTGAASGLGAAATVGFARLGATVHALARSPERAEQAAAAARKGCPAGDVRPAVCDLAERSSIRAFLAGFAESVQRLDVLVNNAGVMPDERERTGDGVELTYATHVLAPWLLIEGLRPLLARAAPSRVINVSSGGQYDQQIPVGDVESAREDYSPKKIYARTKREQLVITEQWAQELRHDQIHVHAMHPGWADTAGVRQWMPVFRGLTRPIIRTPEQGADTIVWLGAAPEAVGSTGRFWHDRRTRPTTYLIGAKADPEDARREVWTHTEALAHADG